MVTEAAVRGICPSRVSGKAELPSEGSSSTDCAWRLRSSGVSVLLVLQNLGTEEKHTLNIYLQLVYNIKFI